MCSLGKNCFNMASFFRVPTSKPSGLTTPSQHILWSQNSTTSETPTASQSILWSQISSGSTPADIIVRPSALDSQFPLSSLPSQLSSPQNPQTDTRLVNSAGVLEMASLSIPAASVHSSNAQLSTSTLTNLVSLNI